MKINEGDIFTKDKHTIYIYSAYFNQRIPSTKLCIVQRNFADGIVERLCVCVVSEYVNVKYDNTVAPVPGLVGTVGNI